MSATPIGQIDFVTGEATGLSIPAHVAALHSAGPDFLTAALRAFGTIAPDNAVVGIAACEPCSGGSTGHKFYLTLDYARDEPGVDHTLFLKFSRDFTDKHRDWQRTEMAGEARFMDLSRRTDFPIRVPKGYFADYDPATGTGIVISECIRFGEGAIEPHRGKCLDHLTLDDPLAYYRTMVTALARLAGTQRAGRLAGDIAALFPWDAVTGSADPIGYSEEKLRAELDNCANFARDCPQLIPPELRDPVFMANVARDALRVRENEAAIRAFLIGNPDLIALCHWNAHIDNCWFWRDAGGLHCGLIDWGRAGQITFGSALWGGLSAAHHDIWDHHLDELLALFVSEYHGAGGPAIAVEALEFHLALHMAAMGVARVFAFPEVIRFRLPGCADTSGPYDPALLAVEPARNCLHIYVNFLKYWRKRDFGAALDRLLASRVRA